MPSLLTWNLVIFAYLWAFVIYINLNRKTQGTALKKHMLTILNLKRSVHYLKIEQLDCLNARQVVLT